jgi:hypothetical protein
MDHDEIRKLLEKYWAAETDLNEEARLKEFFLNNPDIPDDLLVEKHLFMAYEQESMRPALNKDLVSNIELPLHKRVIPIWKRTLKYAAVVIPLAVISYFLIDRNKSVKANAVIADTIKDKEQVVKEAGTALQMLAINMRDGLENIKQLDVLKDIGKELNEQNNKK